MNTFSKTAITFFTASVIATSAFAADENAADRLQSARGSVLALSATLENMGAKVDSTVNLKGAYTYNQKTAIYQAKHADLQSQFDALRAQSAE
ncbi:hypothetical protein HGG82_01595 [Marinomonas sp. M1K-6]|uniref:Uncharacterized protein n=1 Tax=Marinomonas profundi TaxID=2726122 RepID=A0A847R325_9GAMM|nr:hypothetical protein [Marinomonas profundi]NLQ16316.1 hypothetical protein [Marinomonas profundi]UDV03108.1 hypothetical protein J8N69_16400 [Marinomonas profundi]